MESPFNFDPSKYMLSPNNTHSIIQIRQKSHTVLSQGLGQMSELSYW